MKKIRKYICSKDFRKDIAILLLILMVHSSGVASYVVPTGSMNPTILEGDMVLSNKLAYRLKEPFTKGTILEWDTPNNGDIVTFESPIDGRAFVKRVIGVPGDLVKLDGKSVWVNGKKLSVGLLYEEDGYHFEKEIVGEKDYLVQKSLSQNNFKSVEIVVPEKEYFVMGDNRDNSFDSRSWGFLPMENITGKLTLRWMSFDPNNYFIPRLKRIGIIE